MAYIKTFYFNKCYFSIYLYIVNNGIPDNFLTNILSGTLPVFTSWYVVVLVLQYVLFYVIFKFLNLGIKNKIHLLTILTIFQILAFYFINYGRCWWVSTLAFSVGMYYRVYIEQVNAIVTKKIFKLSYLPIGCVFIIGILKLNIEMLYSLTYIVIPLLVIIPFCFYKDFKINKIIGFLSSISYEIYLIHICVFSMLRNRFIYIESTYLYVLLTIIITILLAYPIHKVCNLRFWKSNNE
jgi:Acyltransferase family.